MKVIYIAGPYRSRLGEWQVRLNIRRAEEAAVFVWQNGGVALCPHKNTAGMGGVPGCPDATWLRGDIELLKRCDALLAIDDWESSEGARMEVRYAEKAKIPVFYSADEVIDFLGSVSDNEQER